jgi:hypothetical protein
VITDTRPLRFHTRSRLALARDLAMVLVCLTIVAAFVVDVWKARPTEDLRAAASVAQVIRPA